MIDRSEWTPDDWEADSEHAENSRQNELIAEEKRMKKFGVYSIKKDKGADAGEGGA